MSSILPVAALDRRLIEAQRQYMSPEEMSKHVGGQLSPAECLIRVREILTSKSQLDEVMERRMLLIDMAEHLNWMKNQRDDPESWTHINRAYKLLSDQIERANINVADVSTKLASRYAEYFVTAYTMALERVVKSISEQTGNTEIIEAEVIEEASKAGLVVAKGYLEKVTVREDA